MAIPLPRVVADVEAGGPLATSMRGLNALTQSSLENKIKSAEADYAPYTAYANALSHQAYANYLPWQIKSQVLSNPYLALALKDRPDLLNKMLSEFGEGMSNPNALTGGVTIPAPSQRGAGMLSGLLNKLFHGNMLGSQGGGSGGNPLAAGAQGGQNQNPMTQMPGGGAAPPTGGGGNFPLVPSTQGGAQGAIGAQTAKMVQSPFIQTPTVPNAQGGVTQAPSAETVSSGQKAVLAAKRVAPILQNIMRDWKNVYNLPGVVKIGASALGNLSGASPETLKKFGIDKGAYSKYIKATNNVDKAIIDVMKVYDIHQEQGMNERMGNIIRPHPGEDEEGYFDRVQGEITDLKNQQTINETALGSGFDIGGQGAPQGQSSPPPGAGGNPNQGQSNPAGEPGQISPQTVQALQQTAAANKMDVPTVVKYLSGYPAGKKWLQENGLSNG